MRSTAAIRTPTAYLLGLGKYDRAWGPERPIFGKVRYMNQRIDRQEMVGQEIPAEIW